jgi:sulfur-oxidizing protein SoxX
MPSYYRNDHLVRIGRNFAGKPILSATEIEDIVTFLATLRD